MKLCCTYAHTVNEIYISMEVKIDTKEKFTVVTPIRPELSDNIAAQIVETCLNQLQNPIKNVVLNLSACQTVDSIAAEKLTLLQQQFYEQNASLVICSVQSKVAETLDKMDLLEMLNITPTESEAWDIVQMEEIERELLDSDDMDFENNV